MKIFAEDKTNVTEKVKFVSERVENVVGNGDKCWLPALSPIPTMDSELFFVRVVKSQDCVAKG